MNADEHRFSGGCICVHLWLSGTARGWSTAPRICVFRSTGISLILESMLRLSGDYRGWTHRAPAMGVTYYKRFRMEVDLTRTVLEEALLPEAYEWAAWDLALLERHARAKFESFRSEIDSDVFPCLGDPGGCRNLMSEIVQRATFVPGATWLVTCRVAPDQCEDCGTIQGLVQSGQWGAVQNVGVAPEHRGRGLGKALILKSLAGFRAAGVPHVYLEVTARNLAAVQLYRSVGFCLKRTTYKAVERPTAACAVL